MIAELVTAAVLFAGLLVAVAVIVLGIRDIEIALRIRRCDETQATHLTPGTVTQLRGTVGPHPEHGTIPAAFTDNRCVYRDWKATRRNYGPNSGPWETLDEGKGGVPFVLNDGYGVVEIDPEAADELLLARGDDPSVRLTGDDASERAAELSNVDVEWDGRDGKHSLRQHIIKPGDELRAIGPVTRTESRRSPARYAIGPSAGTDEDIDGKLIVTDWSTRRIKAMFFTGLGKVVGGLVGMATVAGMAINTFHTEFHFEVFAGLTLAFIASILFFSYANDIYIWWNSTTQDGD